MPSGIEIGAYEAKTHLPELLRNIRDGRRYTITVRGKAVADLIPAGEAKRADMRDAAARMLGFMQTQAVVVPVSLKSLIEEGRD